MLIDFSKGDWRDVDAAAEFVGLKPNVLLDACTYGFGPTYRLHKSKMFFAERHLKEWRDMHKENDVAKVEELKAAQPKQRKVPRKTRKQLERQTHGTESN